MSSDRSAHERKLDEFARRYRERLAREWPEGETDVTRIEEIVARVERETMQEIAEEMIREQTGKRKGNQATCPCGARATYRKQAGLSLVTAFGRFRVQRAYFYCAACRKGHCPQDLAWGLGPAHTTPTVQSLAAYLGATQPYVQVGATLRRLRPAIRLDTKSVELIAQRLGEQLPLGPRPEFAPASRPLAAAVDAAMLPTRAGYKETRCGVIYEPEWNPARTPRAEAELRKEYVGTLASREDLVREVCARVEQRRPTPSTKVAALGDGADWIWEHFARYLPQRVEILDFYHVMEHLAAVASAQYSEDTEVAQAWLARMKKNLLRYGPGPLLRALAAWQPPDVTAQEVKRREEGYFTRHQERMDYPTYLAAGFPIGSGAVEGACKHLVADRFRGAGMRWNATTAEPLLQLRAALLTHPDLDLRPYAALAAAA
jgi:hypothetical protein